METSFSAAHALTIAGEREPIHGHNWRVRATVQCDALDADGLVCDFHTLAESLRSIVAPFHNANLNDIAPFTSVNPSAERVAEHIANALRRTHADLNNNRSVRLTRVSVTEAPGCQASYIPDSSPPIEPIQRNG